MKVLVSKMRKLKLLKVELILGSIIMTAVVIGIPVSLMIVDITLLTNPYILFTVGVAMLLFALVDYFIFIRPYKIYRKTPMEQLVVDDEFLYVHTQKEAKIPLKELYNCNVRVELPFLYQREFLKEIIIHIFSDKYGDVVLEVPNYGKFKMRFVAEADKVASELVLFIEENAKKYQDII